MKARLWLALASMMLLATLQCNALSDKAGGFSADFPSAPSEASVPDKMGTVHMFSARGNGRGYLVSYVDLAENTARLDPHQVLDLILGSTVTVGDTLRREDDVPTKGSVERDVVLVNGGAVRALRLIVVKSRAYIVQAAWSTDEGAAAGGKFLESFKLTP